MIPNLNWTPLDALQIFSGNPLLEKIGRIVLLYYTGVWAIVSTFVLYAAKRFHFGPERLGELMSAFGLCTMVAEAVLVRIIVPAVGEIRSMQYGLIAFALQCAVLAFAFEGWQLFLCVFLSTMTNLFYPSLTSLISHVVADDAVGEALGAINGQLKLLIYSIVCSVSRFSCVINFLSSLSYCRCQSVDGRYWTSTLRWLNDIE